VRPVYGPPQGAWRHLPRRRRTRQCATRRRRPGNSPSSPISGCHKSTTSLRFRRPVGRRFPRPGESRRTPPSRVPPRGREPGTHRTTGVSPTSRARSGGG
jgi:hypothetical protein